jgi:hypothetical protein
LQDILMQIDRSAFNHYFDVIFIAASHEDILASNFMRTAYSIRMAAGVQSSASAARVQTGALERRQHLRLGTPLSRTAWLKLPHAAAE